MAPTHHPATRKLPMKLFQGGTRSTLYVETHVSPFRPFGEVKHILASLIQSDRMICAEGFGDERSHGAAFASSSTSEPTSY